MPQSTTLQGLRPYDLGLSGMNLEANILSLSFLHHQSINH